MFNGLFRSSSSLKKFAEINLWLAERTDNAKSDKSESPAQENVEGSAEVRAEQVRTEARTRCIPVCVLY